MVNTKTKTRKTKRTGSRKTPSRFVENALASFFAIVEPEIRKVHPTYISPTVDDFIRELKHLNQEMSTKTTKRTQTQRKHVGGASSADTNMKWLLSFTVGALIGTFNTTCEKLFSYIAITLYAMWGYKIVSDTFQTGPLPGANVALVLSDPAGGINRATCSFFREHISTLNRLGHRFDEHMGTFNAYANEQYSTSPSVQTWGELHIVSRLPFILNTVLNSHIYRLFVVAPISCLLSELGVESCRRICMQSTYRRNTGTRKRGTARTPPTKKKVL
jgi:hypothetical protein